MNGEASVLSMNTMAQRVVRACALCVVTFMLSAGPATDSAFAWSNGPSAAGVLGNGYGTHDWVLERAVSLAGADAAWLDTKIARLHTDDPDYRPKSDQLNHIYNGTRTGRGGPQTVADYYHRAVLAYRRGDIASASRYVGELSHYYSDLCQPYHSYRNDLDARLAAEHVSYERAVDKSHRTRSAAASWVTPVARQRSFDVRAKAVSAALAARKDYPALRKAMRSRGYSSSAQSVTGKITRRRLSRAANDLADIIASIPEASGVARVARVASVKPSQSRPRRSANVAVRVRLVDLSGRVIRGARVTYSWRLGSRVYKTTSYSDASGVATSWHSMRAAAKGKKAIISVRTVNNSVEATGMAVVVPR